MNVLFVDYEWGNTRTSGVTHVTHTHTHIHKIHTHTHIYICMCVCARAAGSDLCRGENVELKATANATRVARLP